MTSARRACIYFAVLVAVVGVLSPLASARDRKPPRIRHDPIATVVTNEAIEITVYITDRSGVFDPTLYYRLTGATEFLRSTLVEVRDRYVATIPAAAVTADIEYFVEAYDEMGNGPSRIGSPSNPLKISVGPADDPTPPNMGDPVEPSDGRDDPWDDPIDGDPVVDDDDSDDPDPGTGSVGGESGVSGGEDEGEEAELPWEIIAAVGGGGLLVAAVVTAAIVVAVNWDGWFATSPGEVDIAITGPPPVTTP